MNPRALLALFTLSLMVSLPASAVEIVRVWPGYRTSDSFESIGEFFGREEFKGGRLVLRSQPQDRNGYYFLTRVRRAPVSTGAIAQLEVILPGSDLARTYRLPVDLPAGGSVLNIGLTGSDWPDATVKPLAWRLTLLSADGSRLIDSQSFLWAQP